MAHRDQLVAMAAQKLGQSRDSIDRAAQNVELTWNIDDGFRAAAKYHGPHLLGLARAGVGADLSPVLYRSLACASAGHPHGTGARRRPGWR
jgi:hypothetical protein